MLAQHPDDLRDAAMAVYQSFLNEPYQWGGQGVNGIDCSGLALEGLKAVGLVPREADYSAAGLWELFADLPRARLESELRRGMFVFYARPDGSIRHVEIVWATWSIPGGRTLVLTIAASGGGSRTLDRAEAKRTDARVKIRRITPGWLGAFDPFQRWPSA